MKLVFFYSILFPLAFFALSFFSFFSFSLPILFSSSFAQIFFNLLNLPTSSTVFVSFFFFLVFLFFWHRSPAARLDFRTGFSISLLVIAKGENDDLGESYARYLDGLVKGWFNGWRFDGFNEIWSMEVWRYKGRVLGGLIIDLVKGD